MTQPNNPVRIFAVGDGTTTAFPFPFRVFSATDVAVFIDGVRQTSGYSVSGIGNINGGSVAFSVAPPLNAAVALLQQVPISRDTDFQVGGDFSPDAVNDEHDRHFAIEQRLADQISRAVRLSDTYNGSIPTIPNPAAGKALKWDAQAVGLQNSLYDPDGLVERAASAEAAATRAAADAAAAALIANQLAASTHVAPVTLTLVAGTQNYDLGADWPDNELDETRYRVVIDRSIELTPSDFSITSAIRTNRTITFANAVASDPAQDELPAGVEVTVNMLAVGLYAYRDKSVLEPHLGDGAVSTRALADGVVTGTKIAEATIPASKLQNSTARGFIRFDAAGAAEVVAPPAGNPRRVIGIDGTGPGWVESAGRKLLAYQALAGASVYDLSWTGTYGHIVCEFRGVLSAAALPARDNIFLQAIIDGVVRGAAGDYLDGSFIFGFSSGFARNPLSQTQMYAVPLAANVYNHGFVIPSGEVHFRRAPATNWVTYDGRGSWIGDGVNPVAAIYAGQITTPGVMTGVRIIAARLGEANPANYGPFSAGELLVWGAVE